MYSTIINIPWCFWGIEWERKLKLLISKFKCKKPSLYLFFYKPFWHGFLAQDTLLCTLCVQEAKIPVYLYWAWSCGCIASGVLEHPNEFSSVLYWKDQQPWYHNSELKYFHVESTESLSICENHDWCLTAKWQIVCQVTPGLEECTAYSRKLRKRSLQHDWSSTVEPIHMLEMVHEEGHGMG